MPTKQELKDKAFTEIDQRADELINLSKQILANPEPGFREFKTAALVGEKFAQMGVPFRSGLGMTGLRGEIIGGTDGPTMAILGELDSLIVNEHPHANFGHRRGPRLRPPLSDRDDAGRHHGSDARGRVA